MQVTSLNVDKQSKIPLFMQISQQLKYLILSGQFEYGTQLPSSRELSQLLKVNRNTINNALETLKGEGLVEIRHGIGTFVKTRNNAVAILSESVMSLARDAVQRAREIGYTADDLTRAIYLVEGHRDALPIPDSGSYLIFVECNKPVLESYKRDLERLLGVKVLPYLIDELHSLDATTQEVVRNAELVVTTYTHVREVNRLLRELNKIALAISAGPFVTMMMQTSGWPKTAKVTVVMVRKLGSIEVITALKDAKCVFQELIPCGLDLSDYESRIRQADYLLLSRGVMRTVQPLLRPHQKYIVYENALDDGSVEMLKKYLHASRGTALP